MRLEIWNLHPGIRALRDNSTTLREFSARYQAQMAIITDKILLLNYSPTLTQ